MLVTQKIFSVRLLEASNKMFSSFKRTSFLTEKQIKYFTYEFKKTNNVGRLYILSKIHARPHNVPDMTSNS